MPSKSKFLLATHNPNKVQEIEVIFRQALVEEIEFVAGIDPGDVVEDGDTIEENSMIKANAWLEVNPDCIVLSDDTGLFVDALDGAPGKDAAIFAGEGVTYQQNCEKLLLDMRGRTDRKAHFSTCATAVRLNSPSVISVGTVDGLIALEKCGQDGFGYDPVFIPGEDIKGSSFAQMSAGAKNMISHRAKAFRALSMGIKNAGW